MIFNGLGPVSKTGRSGFYLGIGIWGVLENVGGCTFPEDERAPKARVRAPKARSPPRLGGLGERRKLPQRGLGRSPSRQRFWEHLAYKMGLFLL